MHAIGNAKRLVPLRYPRGAPGGGDVVPGGRGKKILSWPDTTKMGESKQSRDKPAVPCAAILDRPRSDIVIIAGQVSRAEKLDLAGGMSDSVHSEEEGNSVRNRAETR